MNIRLGIYEIFSRIVPGGVYIAAIGQLLVVLGLLTFDWKALNDISLIASLVLVVVAYIVGGALNPLSFVWLAIFRSQGVSHKALADFKQKYQTNWVFEIEDKDWPVLLALIRTKDMELAGEIERQNALAIMLRNVSLGLAFMGFNFGVSYFLARNALDIFAALFLLVISILVLRESTKFRRWFYDAVFETTLAYRIDLEKIIKPAQSGAKQKSGEK